MADIVQNIAVIGGSLFLQKGHPAIPAVRDACKFRNPAFTRAQGMRASGKKMPLPPQWLNSCLEIPAPHPWAGGLMAPRHLDLTEIAPDVQKIYKFSQPEAAKIRMAPHIVLRSFQKKLPGLLATYTAGYAVAPTGAGKTSMGLACAAHLNTRCLVIVHTVDLANQWIQRAAQQMVDEVGDPVIATLVGEGSKDSSGRIVVALLQTLAAMPFGELYAFGQQFGLVISDEHHHMAAATYNYVMMCMPARYRCGLSATPERTDKLTDMIFYHLPLKLLEVKLGELAIQGLVLLPKIKYVYTGWSPSAEAEEWTDLISEMVSDAERNQLILDEVKVLVQAGIQALILSERVEHCELLAKAAEEQMGVPAAALVGKLSKTKRAQLLEDADRGVLRVVVATQLADEGLDLPGLGAVALCVPGKSLNRYQQRIGRTMRAVPGKPEPIVLDFVDNHDAFKAMQRQRERKLYAPMGCRLS